jgi:hypothetical protein
VDSGRPDHAATRQGSPAPGIRCTRRPRQDSGRVVGRADVTCLRASCDLLAQLNNRFGGAHAHSSLIRYLDSEAADLLGGSYTEETGRELFSAVAEATLLAAWTSYDCGFNGIAQRYFIQALRLAQRKARRAVLARGVSSGSTVTSYGRSHGSYHRDGR